MTLSRTTLVKVTLSRVTFRRKRIMNVDVLPYNSKDFKYVLIFSLASVVVELLAIL